ncbi:RNA polymerase sigma factor [Methylosinus sp. Sm6]|uniref:RNA polymerase sigma factor n=1 Tax=Methylosinus sp. Sm6 TaxID=2866948 RepID=UPI001C99A0ED|nr:sigma-70 family RNA polymerase sigma factor [Methylosinus sp. Sm6]MBY6241344.1 sigma-70 family RNA polymerase sigma factor [Methylosinus sp. Sm6]
MDSTSNLCRAAMGDGVAFARVVEAEQGRVFGFLGRMGLDAATSEDIAQEAFLRVWRNAGSFDPKRGAASTWILAIARNLALGHLRAASRRRETFDEDEALNAPSQEPRPDAVLEDKQRRALLAAALERLAPAERSLLAASYDEGLDLASIARLEGCSPGAAKLRLHRARMKLRRIVEMDDG